MTPEAPPACIVCAAPTQPVDAATPMQPLGALAFTTPGAYGTATFDPGDGSTLLIVVCDSCIEIAAGSNKVVHIVPVRVATPDPHYLLWEPGPDQVQYEGEAGLAAEVPHRNRSTWHP